MAVKFMKLFLEMSAMAVVGTLIAVLIVEWLSGCGEVEYFADGTWRTYDCVFVPYEVEEGIWDEGHIQ